MNTPLAAPDLTTLEPDTDRHFDITADGTTQTVELSVSPTGGIVTAWCPCIVWTIRSACRHIETVMGMVVAQLGGVNYNDSAYVPALMLGVRAVSCWSCAEEIGHLAWCETIEPLELAPWDTDPAWNE